jgi:DNA invertase Pin-like site-specific DNA recombinase
VLVVTKLDRLGRNAMDVGATVAVAKLAEMVPLAETGGFPL